VSIAVALDQLRKTYRGPPPVTALAGISLDIPVGGIYGLLGPNGAGKTTTIGICTTRVRATSGRAVVGGHDVAEAPVAVRAEIGVVSQAITLDRSCTVAENIEFHCRYFGMPVAGARQRTAELLDRFKLADRAKAMPGQLSGGLAQRVQLARAIAHRPTVLFLDEPTAGLDPQSRLALWDLVQSLREEGITVVLTTHYMEEADRLCSRLAIVDHGRILAEGSPESLKAELGGTVVVEAAVGDVDGARREAASLPMVREIQATERGLRLLLSTEEGAVAAVLARLANHQLQDLSVVEPSLETAFIQLTGRDLRE
jgi:ABC-2 type transport system ATP-binding protein